MRAGAVWYTVLLMEDTAAIYTKGLTKSYGALSVLKGVDLRVERGTMLALLGPNGAGKTTIVRILSTLLPPDGGEAKVNGLDVVKEANAVRHVIGLTGQYAAIDDYLTGRQNLVMMGRLYHLSKEDSEKRAQELLERFSLVDAAERTAKTYSGGMRRRLDLAASLVATPPIIFLDEPTTGLDPRSRIQMWDVIEDLRRGGATILLTTQYLEEADKLADRIAVIDRGTVIAEGTADELKAKVGKERLEIIVKENALDAAAQAMGQGARVEREDGAVSIETANVGEVRRALESLEAAGVAVESLSLHKPTLDDVFLKLTGHEAEGKTTETV